MTPDRLSEIPTARNLLEEAWQVPGRDAGTPETVRKARDELVAIYQRAVFAYLCGCVRDPAVARDLAQKFWLTFVRGGFDKAAPEKGSFRKYLKTALSHLATQVRQRARPPAAALPADVPAAPTDDWTEFDAGCRRGFLNDAWERLANDPAAGRGQYTALWLKTDHPDLPDTELARMMSAGAGAVTHDAFRETLQRARGGFAECVYRAVAASLRAPTRDDVAAELGELGLLRYCRSVVDAPPGERPNDA